MQVIRSSAVIAILLLGSTSVCHGQTLQLVTACERDPSLGLGNTVTIDEDNVVKFFSTNIPSEKLKINRITQEQLTPKGLIAAIEELKIDPKDTIVFYYSGHGAYDDRLGHFLDFGKRGPLPRSNLRDGLKAKKAKFTVLLTDCCFSYKRVPSNTPDDNALYSRVKSARPDVRVVSPIAKSLFFEPSGLADWTSCSKGQVSVGYDDYGSLFTQVLLQYMDLHRRESLDWKHLTEKCSSLVVLNFKIVEKSGVDRTGNDGTPNQFTQEPTAFYLPGVGEILQRETAGDFGNDKGLRFGVKVKVNQGPGVRIIEVREGSIAEKLKFKVGDVILTIGKTTVKTLKDFDGAVERAGVEDEIEVRRAADRQVYRIRFGQ